MTYTIKAIPENTTYILAIDPVHDGVFVFWFDDSGRERGARADDLEITNDGKWKFTNSDKGEKIVFTPAK